MPHLDEGQLTLLLDNELDAVERTDVEAHLQECAECRRLLEETRGFMAEADRLIGAVDLPPRTGRSTAPPGAPAPVPTTGRPFPWRSMAWAATVVLAAGLGWYASDSRFHRPASSLSDAVAPTPAETVAAQRADESRAPAPVSAELAAGASGKTAPTAAAPASTALARSTVPPTGPSGNLATNQAGTRAEQDQKATGQLAEGAAPSPAPAATPTAPPAPARDQAAPSVSGLAATGDVARRSIAKSRESQSGFQEITLDQAVRALGGTIRLLDGLTPIRAETGPPVAISNAVGGLQLVRIVYEDPPGRELWLSQQRLSKEADPARMRALAAEPVLEGDTLLGGEADGRRTLRWRDQDGFLLALSGYLPGDSLKSLARRVR